jgi:hypothetical protein
VVTVALGIAAQLTGAAPASAPEGRKTQSAPSSETLDRLPYRIEAHLAIDPQARIDARGRMNLIAGWQALVHRFVGAPWVLTIAENTGPLSTQPIDTLEPSAFAERAKGRDKVWVIRLGRDGSKLIVSGREYDVLTRRLGPIRYHAAPFVSDLPRSLLMFSLHLFSPSAEIGEQSGGGVALTVQGASLEAGDPLGQVVSAGTVFEPYRIVSMPSGEERVVAIPFTFLRIESIGTPEARAAIVTALRDPLTERYARKNRVVARGASPGEYPTRLQFIGRDDKAPAAGYALTARVLPSGPPREVGTTDREGRIVLEPGFADNLVIVRLLAGNSEPMVEMPIMPGESDRERVIPFEPRPLTVALEAQLDSLRDEVIDLIAIRARLEARLKARADGEDWAGVEETIKEYNKLTPRQTFADRLKLLKDDAMSQQARSKVAILTKNAQSQVSELQAMIDRYLDDEAVKAYSEMVQNVRAEAAKKAKPAKKAVRKPQP